MNKLSFLSSIPSNKDTYIYVLPTNSQKSLNLDAVSIKVHILDLRGNSLLVFPAAGASSDGVCFTLSNLANLGSGTYAIYLELLYAHHQEFYPNDSVKYITIKDDDSGNLTFVNMFTAELSSIVPPQDTKSDLTDVLHVHDIDLKSISTNTLAPGKPANVYLDQNDNLIFQIPVGPKGDKGDPGPTGADGKTSYLHIAYANSADGKDGFYVGGGINLITGTSRDLQTAQDSYDKTSGGQIYGFNSNELNSLAGNQVTVSAFIHNTTSHIVNLLIWTDSNNFGVGTGVPAGTDGYSTVSGYNISPKATRGNINIRSYTDNVSISGVQYKELKLEKSSVATPWSPAPSEAHPSYMGTYTDYIQTASLDPTAYQWSLIKGATGPTGATGPQGSRGYSFWSMKMAAGGNISGRYITDLYNASKTNMPMVGDTVLQPDGNVYQVTGVSNTDDGSNGGGTFSLGASLFSIKGATGAKGADGVSPSEDDILAKTKQYVDNDILNRKW